MNLRREDRDTRIDGSAVIGRPTARRFECATAEAPTDRGMRARESNRKGVVPDAIDRRVLLELPS